jgi:O-antigen/teichoic acid export membrane protein
VVSERASYREGASFGLLGFAAVTVLGLVGSVATARLYGAVVVGQWALALAPITVVEYLSATGVRPALVRELATLPPRAPRVTGLVVAVSAFSLGLTATGGALALGGAFFMFIGPVNHPELFAPAAVGMVGYVLLAHPAWTFDSVLTAFLAGRELFWVRLHQAMAFTVSAVAFGVVAPSVWGLVLATAAGSLTSLIHRLVIVRRYVTTRLEPGEIRNGFRALPGLLRFGLKTTPGTLAVGVSEDAGTWVIGAVGSLAAVGAYSRAWMLGLRLIQVAGRVCEMLLPTLVGRRSEGDRLGFDRALIDTIRYAVTGMLLIAAAGGGVAHGIMSLFGPDFSPAADALTVLLLVPTLSVVSSVQRGGLLLAVNQPLTGSLVAVITMLVTLAACLTLTLAFGLVGTAVGVLVGAIVDVSGTTFAARRHLAGPMRQLWPWRQRLAVPLAYAAGFGVAHFTYSALGGHLGLLAGLGLGSGAYAVTFLTAGGLNDRDRRRIAWAWNGLRSARADRDATPASPVGSTLEP